MGQKPDPLYKYLDTIFRDAIHNLLIHNGFFFFNSVHNTWQLIHCNYMTAVHTYFA